MSSRRRIFTPPRPRRRCANCQATEMSCASMARDTGRNCCPNCDHDTNEEND